MRTLVLNGSPRKAGDTAALIAAAQTRLEGEVKVVSAFHDDISPCIDCRFCWKNSGCAIKDDMQAVYTCVQEWDNLIIAAPIFFSELPGPLLSLASRFQTWWSADFFRKQKPRLNPKNGLLLMTGGGKGPAERAIASARMLFKITNTACVAEVYSMSTDTLAAANDTEAIAKVRDGALLLNRLYAEKQTATP